MFYELIAVKVFSKTRRNITCVYCVMSRSLILQDYPKILKIEKDPFVPVVFLMERNNNQKL